MAKHSGIIKELSGKVHNVVGSSWNGIDYVRGISNIKRKRTATAAQEEQRAKFALATSFFREFNQLVPLTFEPQPGKSTRNLAVSQVVNEAVVGTYPDFTIDYSKVLVAQGKLKKPINPAVSSPEPGKLVFTWNYDPAAHKALTDHNAILVAFEPEEGAVLYSLYGGERHTGTGMLDVAYFSGKEVRVWIAFRSKNEMQTSDSMYLGAVMVS